MLTGYGKRQWTIILIVAALLAIGFAILGWWIGVAITILAALALLSFFRDPSRSTPSQKNVMVSPADGRVSSIHKIDRFEPFDGPATCVRIFLSVMDVHVNRAPCYGMVDAVAAKPGQYLNALNPKSAEVNASNLIVLIHPMKRHPVAALRQVAGLIARNIVCGVRVGQTVHRGQRIGMIKFGSTTELYIPDTARPEVVVRQGQYVYGGLTVLAKLNPIAGREADEDEASHTTSAAKA